MTLAALLAFVFGIFMYAFSHMLVEKSFEVTHKSTKRVSQVQLNLNAILQYTECDGNEANLPLKELIGLAVSQNDPPTFKASYYFQGKEKTVDLNKCVGWILEKLNSIEEQPYGFRVEYEDVYFNYEKGFGIRSSKGRISQKIPVPDSYEAATVSLVFEKSINVEAPE